jgi:hypothetical protein
LPDKITLFRKIIIQVNGEIKVYKDKHKLKQYETELSIIPKGIFNMEEENR